MGRDYVSEQRPPTGLLFIPQLIYEHGEPQWNDIHRVKLPIRPPELSASRTSSHIVAMQKKVEKEMIHFVLPSVCFTLRKVW
jgi:hypothetical protein